MNNRLQQTFVTEYNGRASTFFYAIGVEPLADISCLNILCWCRDIVDMLWRNLVGVLIEYGLALLLQSAEKRLLNLLKKVEAYKHIGIIFEIDALVGSHLAIECPFIGQLFFSQQGVELVINLANMAPKSKESLFEF